MPCFICTSCGTQYPETPLPPAICDDCADERHAVPVPGPKWTTREELARSLRLVTDEPEPSLHGIGTTPSFAIGQRALLVRSPGGNVLWDCISFLDQATIDTVKGLGGISAIALSHPHFYTTVVDWAQAFGDVPVYIHADDRHWMMRPEGDIRFWDGETLALHDGMTLIRCGGHFEGSCMLHWPAGAGGKGALLTGDTLAVVRARTHVTFMYSYPGVIPLPAAAVRRIADAIAPFPYARVYDGFWDGIINADAKAIVENSAERYVEALATNRAQTSLAPARPPRTRA